MLEIKQVNFITGAAAPSQFIKSEKPIIAVCGKSNVGKSSFINMLANNKKLAKVSKEPGRTRLVNYFDFGAFILADLPGYGFARVSKDEKLKWANLLDKFFEDKGSIAHVFALADIRHGPTADDRQMIEYLYFHQIPFSVIAAKADKLSKAGVARGKSAIAEAYKCGAGNVTAVSAINRQGLEEVLCSIEKIIALNSTRPAE